MSHIKQNSASGAIPVRYFAFMYFIVNLPKFLGYLPIKSKNLRLKWNSISDWTKKLSAAAKIKDSNRWHCNIYTLVCICDENKNLWFSCNSLIVKKNTQRTAVRKTKFSIAFIGETRKKERFSIKYAVNKAFITCKIPVSCENRQTENLGDFGRFQPFRMRTFQILRFAEKVVNPCNSPSKQDKKKAEWRVTIRHQGKKMVEHIYANQNLFSVFVTLWLPNIRTGTRELR